MEKIKEVIKERNLLLLEFHKVEAVDRILKERKAAVSPGKNIALINQAAKAAILDQLRGGLLHRGIWRIEITSVRYFKRLIKKLEEMGHDLKKAVEYRLEGKVISEESVEKQMGVYESSLVKRVARGGTITKLIKGDEPDWNLLDEEVSGVLQDITSLIALLEHLTIHNYNTFQNVNNSIYELCYSVGYRSLRTEALQLCMLHWEDLEKILKKNPEFIKSIPHIVKLIPKVISWEQILEIYSWGIKKRRYINWEDFSACFLFWSEQGLFPGNNWLYFKEMYLFLSNNFASVEDFSQEFVPFLITTQKIPVEKAVEICEILGKSNIFKFFKYHNFTKYPTYRDYDNEVQLFFPFCEKVMQVIVANKIDTIYAIDRGGRIIGFLIHQVLSDLGKKGVRIYFIHGTKKGQVTFYGPSQVNNLTNKRVLVLDEYVDSGNSINSVITQLKQSAKVVVAATFSSKDYPAHRAVSSRLPSWYEKKEYSGMVEKDEGGVVPGDFKVAREVRKSLSGLAKAVVIYLRCRGF